MKMSKVSQVKSVVLVNSVSFAVFIAAHIPALKLIVSKYVVWGLAY